MTPMPPPPTAREERDGSPSDALPFAYRAARSGEALDVVGDLLELRNEPTQEAPMLMVETTCPPGGGPPTHAHAAEELFLVRDGRFAFFSSEPGAERVAGPGDVIHVPGGRPHAYRNVGSEPARMLVVFDDGRQIVRLWREIGRPVDPKSWRPLPPPPLETIVAIAREHGVELVGPPPS
jgi:quercetin dioxygenase-like cupin family protein